MDEGRKNSSLVAAYEHSRGFFVGKKSMPTYISVQLLQNERDFAFGLKFLNSSFTFARHIEHFCSFEWYSLLNVSYIFCVNTALLILIIEYINFYETVKSIFELNLI